MTTRFADHLITGDHASRPAATTVPEGTLYSCTDHAKIYQSDGAVWSDYAVLGGGAPIAHATSHENGGGDEIDVSGLSGVLADEQNAGAIKGVAVDDAAIADGRVLVYRTGVGLGYEDPPSAPSSGGGLVLLEQHTASGSASLDFTAWRNDSLYDEYQIELVNIITSANTQIGFRMSTDGGSSYDSGANYEYRAGYAYSGGTGPFGEAGASALWTKNDASTLHANGAYCGTYRLYGASSTALYKHMLGNLMLPTSSFWFAIHWMGVWKSTNDLDAIRLIPASGTLTSGTMRIYGLAKT